MKKPVVSFAVLILLFWTIGTARAATYVVTKIADTNDGVCDADCSLREAVAAAANSPQSSDIIEFSALFDLPQTIVLNSTIEITENIEIRGKGADKLAVSGGGINTLFFIFTPGGNPDPAVVFYDLHLTDAPTAVYNDSGNLTLEKCLLSDNILDYSKYGGAALHHHSGTLIINNSTFRNNQVTDSSSPGGAISLYTGTATISNTTFTGNSAVDGSVFHSEFGTTTFINSTISGNVAPGGFGATYVVTTALGTINMVNVTVTQNQVRDNGTAVGRNFVSGRISIKNTIVADNINLPSFGETKNAMLGIFSYNVIGVNSLGNNIVGFAFPNDGFPVGSPNANNDYVGVFNAPFDPQLTPLGDYGGATQTHGLLTGSAAIDHGTSIGAPATDQRGVARPQGAGIDIGSFEKVPSLNPPLQIVTDSILPPGVLNQVYSMQIVAADGTPPYAFSLTSGDLPEGITLSNGGLLSGMLKQFGQFSFTVTATDSASETVQKTFYLTIQPPPLVILTSTLPYGNQNQPYSLQIAVDGDAPPYVFSQTGGALPNGISLSSSGLLSGTPTEFGTFDFEVTVTDFFDTTAQRSFFLTVFPELRIPTNPNLPTGITNQFYSRQIYAEGGITPYAFSLASGDLPSGISLSANGVVSGVASQPGTFSFVVEVTDSQGIQVQKTFRLTISNLYIVTTEQDTNDGVCDAHCSLREAVAVGDSIPGSSNVIEFSSFFNGYPRIYLNSPITINKTTEIRGTGRNRTRISSANPASNIGPKFRILGTADAVFRDLRMDDGGFNIGTRSIENQSSGQLTIENSIFQGSFVTNEDGGAILQTAGTLSVNNSTFRDNFISSLNSDCAGKGAAIAILGGTARITNSAFNFNSSPAGSVIYANGAMTIENSTISSNRPSTFGCGSPSNATILNESGSISLMNSTVFDNLVNGVSGAALSGNISIKNSIIARHSRYGGGSVTSPNIGAGVVSLGHNLIGYAPTLTAGLPNSNNDYVGTAAVPLDPLLDALALNGGETETHALQGASLAINRGASDGAPAADQRGVARPVGAGVDIGAFETDVPITSAQSPAGSNVNVPLGSVSVTFSNIDDAGTTTQIPIYPAISGTLPGGFSFGAGYPAFQITTTANYTGTILVCIQVPPVTAQTFYTLRLLHNENGALVDRTVSHDPATRTICAQTTSLSPFAVAQTFAPTAANISISGRVLAGQGGLRNAVVYLTDSRGQTRSTRSNSFGYYRFEGLEAGQTVVIGVNSKLYQFEPRVLSLSEDLADIDFTPSGKAEIYEN